jgi:hypothetical protein
MLSAAAAAASKYLATNLKSACIKDKMLHLKVNLNLNLI